MSPPAVVNTTSRAREFRTDRRHRIDAVDFRHSAIYQRHVWPVSAELGDRLISIGGLPNDPHIGLRINGPQQSPPSSADDHLP
jgi:hypothetical protein